MKASKKTLSGITSIIASFALTAALAYSIYREDGVSGLGDIFSSIHVNYLLTYIGLSLAGLLLRAWRYLVCIRSIDETQQCVGAKEIIITTGIRNGFVDFLPARLGELTYFYVLNRYNVALSLITTVFGICTALDIVVLLFVVFLASLLSIFNASSDLIGWQIAPVFLGLSILFLYCLMYIDRLLDILRKLIPNRLEKVSAFISKISIEIKQARTSKKYPSLLGLTLLLRIAKYASLYFLLMSVIAQFGFKLNELDPLVCTVAFIAAEASASLPISGFMGFGAYEGAWQTVFLATSTKIPSLSSVIFLVHIISQIVGYFIAVLCLIAFALSQLGLNKR